MVRDRDPLQNLLLVDGDAEEVTVNERENRADLCRLVRTVLRAIRDCRKVQSWREHSPDVLQQKVWTTLC